VHVHYGQCTCTKCYKPKNAVRGRVEQSSSAAAAYLHFTQEHYG
jgi:hypothetical protein